jgi:hypothetical protein
VLSLASGRDYTRQDLGATPRPAAAAPPDREFQSTPAALDRLRDAAALGDCLRQIELAHGSGAAAVDYARFEGKPALVVTLSGTGGMIVVGPDCGLSGTGEIYPTPR